MYDALRVGIAPESWLLLRTLIEKKRVKKKM